MSQFTSNNTSNNNTTGGFSDTRPEHHIHGSADPLPGTRGVNPAAYDSMESSTAGAGAPTSTNFGGVTGDRHHESSHLPGGLSSHGDKTHTDRRTETGAGRFESADNHTGVLGSHNDNARTDRQTDTGAFNSSTQRQPESGHHTGALGSHAATHTDRQTDTGAGQTHSGAGYDAQRQTQSGHHTGDLGRNTGDDRHTGTGTGPLDQHKG